jgi:HSP20 family protein
VKNSNSKEDKMEAKDIQVKEKKEVATQGEHTQEGPFFVPNVDIFEDTDQLVLLADMPGVSKDNIDIRIEDGQLLIKGKVSKETPGDYVLSEYSIGDYHSKYNLSAIIDQAGIQASMKNGVLSIVLPKSDRSKPKKIAIKST